MLPASFRVISALALVLLPLLSVVEEGALADLLLVNANPLEDSRWSRSPIRASSSS